MKRASIVLVLAALAAMPLVTEASAKKAPPKRTICHRTSSATRPYVKLRVSSAQYRAHSRHAADLVPAPPGGCPTTVLTPTSGGTTLRANLVGEAEQPAGDPVGTGTAVIRLRPRQGQVCFQLDAQNITLPGVGAHIHHGAAGVAGPIVVSLTAPNASGKSAGCVTASRTVVAEILSDSESFYANVHTTDFPNGAIRGQLGGTQAQLGRTITVQLTGAQECGANGQCGVGDTDGAGTEILRFRPDAGQVCFKISVRNLTLPSVGAHIHRGARGTNGPIVVPFTAPGATGTSAGCTAADQALINEIVGNPAGFYANVHTPDFPAGAIRAQLG